MKLSQVFINRESMALYLAFCNTLHHLFTSLRDLSICIVLLIIFIPLVILELLMWFIISPLKTFKKFWSRG